MGEQRQERQQDEAQDQPQEDQDVGVRRSREVTIRFSEDAYQETLALARRKGQDLSEYIQAAIELQKWFDETEEQGGHILVERSGKVREVVRTR